jgi:predicted O-linked N-acetylglucosamine transferase (SPINDLY family)
MASSKSRGLSPPRPSSQKTVGTSANVLARAIEAFRAGKLADAKALCETIRPGAPEAIESWHLLSVIAAGQGDFDGAVAAGRRVLDRKPDHAEAQRNLGALLARLGRLAEALPLLERAVAQHPDAPDGLLNLASALRELGRPGDALAAVDRVLRRQGDHADGWRQRGIVLSQLDRKPEAILAFERSLQLAPNAAVFGELSGVLRMEERLGDAIAAARHALALDPKDEGAAARLLHLFDQACDWAEAAKLRPQVRQQTAKALAQGRKPAETPLAALTYEEDPTADLELAAAHARAAQRRAGSPLPRNPRRHRTDERIRLGYISADFCEHAVSQLLVRTLELHDRKLFAITAYSTGSDDRSALRQRIMEAADDFIDIREVDHRAAAERSARDGIDILIDLTLHTAGSRLEIAALRPAPLQVGWLGFPGSSGADYFDYLLTDRIVSPPDQAPFYSEQLSYLPETFQPNDDLQPIAAGSANRADYGLPADGFVFCSFNQGYKFEPVLFDLWMGLLRDIPGSVLWLHRLNALAPAALQREAAARAVAPERLVFADRPEKPVHLRRLGLADLALDTRIYNGHTTSSDALWAGLPVLTLQGRHFPARVTASVLQAIGLPELVAHDLGQYREIALALARAPAALAELKARLVRNRRTRPLFDSPRFTRHLEMVYRAMWRRHQSGLPPALLDPSPPARDIPSHG